MGFFRQEYWSGLPFPSPGDIPAQGSNPCLLYLLHWQVDSLPLSQLGSLKKVTICCKYSLVAMLKFQGHSVLLAVLLGCTYCRAYIPFENFNPTHFLKSGEESWVSVPFPQGMITTSSFSCGLRSSCKSMTIFWSGILRAHLNPEFCQNRSLYTVCVIFFWALGARRNLWS